MAPGAQVAGFYELPVHIAVAHDVLGSDCSTLIGGLPARVLAPGPVPGGLDYPAIPPALRGVPGDRLGNPFDWAITYAGEYTQDGATCLRRVGIILSEPKEALPELPRDFGPAHDADRPGGAGGPRRVVRSSPGVDRGLDRAGPPLQVTEL
jgi:hypothetical protein